MNLFALLDHVAQRFPDQGAVFHGQRRCCTEEVLLEHPGVSEACVVGAPDDLRQQLV